MTGIVNVLQGWLADAEALAGRLPDVAGRIAAGSWPAMLLATALGLALLVAGWRVGRVLAALAAGLLGYVAGRTLATALGIPLGPQTWSWVVAGALGLSAAFVPAMYPAALGAAAGALLGARVPIAGSVTFGAIAGAAAGAALALVLRRLVLAATGAAAGSVLLSAVLLALASRYPSLAILRERPVLLAAAGALLFVAGTAFQLGADTELARARRTAGAGSRQPLEH